MTTFDEMTPEERRREQLAGPRVVVMALLGGGLMLLAAFLMGVCAHKVAAAPPMADHRICSVPNMQLPRRVVVSLSLPQWVRDEAQLSMAAWNTFDQRYDWFIEVPADGTPWDVYILPMAWGGYTSPQTSVYNCGTANFDAIIWMSNASASAHMAMAHELGHALNINDHAYYPTGAGPGAAFCDGPNPDPYRGIMSYCEWPWGGPLPWPEWVPFSACSPYWPTDCSWLRRYWP